MVKKMIQQSMIAPGKIEFYEIPIPDIKDDEVLVKIMKIGICGSDIHVYHGKHPFTKYPVTQGHEVSGEIVMLGKNVNNLSLGQKITIEPQIVCGKCYPCLHGQYNLCEDLKVMGFQTTGTASTYFAVDTSHITVLPDDFDYIEGAMIEPLAVAVHAVKRFGNITDKKVAVIGAGPIGILVAQSAKAMGAGRVMITDINDFRLKKASECGIDYAFNTKKTDFGIALLEAFGADKADVIFDCAGNNITIGEAIANARKGSTIILVAVFEGVASLDLAVLNDHELDLNTTMMYRHEDYLDAIRFVNEKKINLKTLITKTFAFREYLDAYKYIDENRDISMKIIIDVQK